MSVEFVLGGSLAVPALGMLAFGWWGRPRAGHDGAVSWRERWRWPFWLLPALAVVLLVMAAFVAVGWFAAALGVLYGLLGVAAVGMAVGVARQHRRGRRRAAAVDAVVALLLVLGCVALILGWRQTSTVVAGLLALGLLVWAGTAAVRRWGVSDPLARRALLWPVLLGVGLVCQTVSQLLPSHQYRALELTLVLIGIAALLAEVGPGVGHWRCGVSDLGWVGCGLLRSRTG